MTKTKSTKRALLMSALALLACVSMLVGSTFAWFTDSVTSGNNKIQAGTLKIDLELLEKDGSWTSIKDSGKAIFDYDKWEPGYTDVKVLRITNEGTLALKWIAKFVSESKLTDLANVIDVYVKEGVEEYPEKRDDLSSWTKAGTVAEFVNTIETTTTGNLEAGATDYLGIALKMQETAGNKYQGMDLGGAFDIMILATQFTKENDSFGNDYDKDAARLVWDGTVDTSWYDAVATSYELSTPAELAGLAELVNSGINFAGKSIKLAADMDLNDLEWKTIGIKNAKFNGKFYGNGYTIYNLNVSGTTGVGLFGFAGNDAHIEGVHIVGANVIGENSVGAVVGYAYLAKDCLKYCVVENAFVFAAAGDNKEDGDKVGAVAGWTSNGNIIGNKAINCELYGCRDVGGIVGYVNGENRAVEVSGNTVENVTVRVINVEDYAKELGSNINATVGRIGTAVTVHSNNGNIVKKENIPFVSANDALKEAVLKGGEVVVNAGNYTFPGTSFAADTVLICAPGTVFEGKTSLNINGATVVGATFTSENNYLVKQQTINGIFKDCVFTNTDGLRSCYAGETVVFENCVFDGDLYGIHFDSGKNDVVFKGCTFSGFNTFGAALTQLTFEGCTFVANGKSNYNGINMWGDTDLIGCTFIFDGTAGEEWVDLCNDNKTVTFTDCVVTDGDTEKGIETVVGDFGDGNTIIIDGAYYVATAEQLRNLAANATGDVAILLGSNITLGDDTTQKSMGAYFLNAKNVTIIGNGHTLTLKGPMPGNDWQAQYYAGIIAPNATVTVKDLTIVNEKLGKDNTNISADRKSVYTMVRGTSVLFENVDFVGGVQVVNNTKFVDCTFEENVLVANAEGYATNGKFCVFIDFQYDANGVCTVDFEDCTFDASGYGCVKVAGNKGANITVNVKDSSFTNTCPSNSWSTDTPKYDVKMTGANITVNDLGGNTWSKGANAGFGNG